MNRNKSLPYILVAVIAFMGRDRATVPGMPQVLEVPAQLKRSVAASAPAKSRARKVRKTGPRGGRSPSAAAAKGDAESWRQTLRLYDEFFGLEHNLEPKQGLEVDRVVALAREGSDAERVVAVALGQEPEVAEADRLAALAPAIREQATRRDYALEFLVALVPDPVDSQMPAAADEALDAIQKGLANSKYLLSRSWLPWTEAAAEQHIFRRCPGLLLFRRDARGEPAGGPDRLLGVFLVGETPKMGIHKAAFHQALRLIGALGGIGRDQPAPRVDHPDFGLVANRARLAVEPLRILGPSYSGSAESLRLALLNGLNDEFQLAGPSRGLRQDPLHFEIVTGSATAPGLEALLTGQPPPDSLPSSDLIRSPEPFSFSTPNASPDQTLLSRRVQFFRTVLPDDVLSRRALGELHETMGWDLCKVALITERDTLYGQMLENSGETALAELTGEPAEECAHGGKKGTPLVLTFPSHVSAVRTAAETGAAKRRGQQPEEIRPRPPKADLDLSLADHNAGADLVPEFSPLTAPATELELANLLEALSREDIRYVGIEATDLRDRLFLADRVRRVFPDAVLFTMGGDLLFAHRQAQASMNGLVVISSYPLLAEGGKWLHAIQPEIWDRFDRRLVQRFGDRTLVDADRMQPRRRQFGSEFEQGIFHAVEALMRPNFPARSLDRSRVALQDPALGWISTNSSGTLWPVLTVEIDRRSLLQSGAHVLAFGDPDGSTGDERKEQTNGLAARADFELLLLAALLCGLGWWMRRVALIERPAGRPAVWVPDCRGLLASGLGLAAAASAALVALDSLCYLPADWQPDQHPVAEFWHLRAVFVLIALLAAYAFLAWCFAAALRPAGPRRGPGFGPRRLDGVGVWVVVAAATLILTPYLLIFLFIPGEVEYYHLRVRVLSSGLSPIVTLAWMYSALLTWVLLELKRRRLIAWQDVGWPIAETWDPALRHCSGLTDRLRCLIGGFLPRSPRFWAVAAVALAAPLYLLHWVQPLADTRAFARFFLVQLLAGVLLCAISFHRFWKLWQGLDKLLERLEQTPLAARFADLQNEVCWKPMHSFGWQIPKFTTLMLSAERLNGLVSRHKLDPALLHDARRERLSRLVSVAFAADCDGRAAREIQSRQKLRLLVFRASQDLGRSAGDSESEEFLALRVISYLRYLFAQLRSSLMEALLPGLLLLCAVTSYAFQPKRFLSLGLFAALLAAIALTLGVFVAMNRSRVLNAIAGSASGEGSFDRAFFVNVLAYGVLPLVGLVATQVPEAGQLLDFGVKPMLRVFGIG